MIYLPRITRWHWWNLRRTWNSSGAAYGGDPQKVLRCWSMVETWVAKPKSPTLTSKQFSDADAKNTFSAFRSRWIQSFSCYKFIGHFLFRLFPFIKNYIISTQFWLQILTIYWIAELICAKTIFASHSL